MKQKKFNNVEKPIEEVCILDDYPRFLDKVIKDYLAKHRFRRGQVHEVCKFDDDSLYLDDLFNDELITYTPFEEKVESCCEDVCIVDEPLFF